MLMIDCADWSVGQRVPASGFEVPRGLVTEYVGAMHYHRRQHPQPVKSDWHLHFLSCLLWESRVPVLLDTCLQSCCPPRQYLAKDAAGFSVLVWLLCLVKVVGAWP